MEHSDSALALMLLKNKCNRIIFKDWYVTLK